MHKIAAGCASLVAVQPNARLLAGPMTEPKRSVLIVDDSPDGREMLAEYLTFRGFDVIEATTGEEALARARSHHPAVILMDLQMPGMGGWEATRQLKAEPATKDIIVIALTAHALTPDEAIARQAGCDGFIAKPFDITAVADAIGEVLQRGRRGLAVVDRLQPMQGDAGEKRNVTTT
jgi:two-component system, cell cycle response regulator DivK